MSLKKANIVSSYANVRLKKNPQASNSFAEPIQEPKAKECRVNLVIQTLHIGQWKDLNNLRTLHWGQVNMGLYKYGRSLIAYFVLNEAYSTLMAPGDLKAVST